MADSLGVHRGVGVVERSDDVVGEPGARHDGTQPCKHSQHVKTQDEPLFPPGGPGPVELQALDRFGSVAPGGAEEKAA